MEENLVENDYKIIRAALSLHLEEVVFNEQLSVDTDFWRGYLSKIDQEWRDRIKTNMLNDIKHLPEIVSEYNEDEDLEIEKREDGSYKGYSLFYGFEVEFSLDANGENVKMEVDPGCGP